MAYPQYGAPGPAAPIDHGDMSSTYAPTGLAGLAQGFTQGLQIGHNWGNEADKLAMEGRKMDEAAMYHKENMARMAQQAEETNAIRQQVADQGARTAAATGPVQMSQDGKMYWDGKGWKPMPTGTGKQDKKDSESLNSAAAAFMGLDKYSELASGFAPKSSGLAAAGMAPLEWLRSKAMQTSPENNLADKAGQVATLYATAINKAGGGRLTETEVANMAKSMGGNGIGETQENIGKKHDSIKNELAAKTGMSRKQIEEHVAALNAQNAGILKELAPNGSGGGKVSKDWRSY